MLDLEKIGRQIALLRKERGLTGEKFAERLGVSAQAVSKWENGKNLPESALLPALAELLDISIDALLLPQELLILQAVLSNGSKSVNITSTVNSFVKANELHYNANAAQLCVPDTDGRLHILTVKYQTPKGVFYAFAPHNETLSIHAAQQGLSASAALSFVGAYYGCRESHRDVMEKMRHYEYFHWKEIHVNHEAFPSSPNVDEPEYLTLVYLNADGIHVISCRENETLRYCDERTRLELKDTDSYFLLGIDPLGWDMGMDCCWAGAVWTALDFMGEKYSYEQIMGMSGACYRICFTEIWDWSATDALVAFPYSKILFRAIGYEEIFAARLEKEARSEERQRIVEDLAQGKPVIAINLRVAAEWGVLCGYSENGKTLYCRTYYDKPHLNEQQDYLETDNWPFLITHFGEKREALSPMDALLASLQALTDSFTAPCNRGYYQGREAYQKWIAGLENEALWREHRPLIGKKCSKEDVERRLSVNGFMLMNLCDARRSAAVYLDGCVPLLTDESAQILSGISAGYRSIETELARMRQKLYDAKEGKPRYYCADGSLNTALLREQAAAFKTVLQTEEEIYGKALALREQLAGVNL